MKIRAQIGMVLNLDKCIGCHTCSVTCKNVWTNREGVEYAWFNNVETKPGIGLPQGVGKPEEVERRLGPQAQRQDRAEDGRQVAHPGQDLRQSRPAGDRRLLRALRLRLRAPADAGESQAFPTARPRSKITGERMEKIEWGPNWEEILGGEFAKRSKDVNFEGVQKEIYGQFENTFMMYLPRLCEHCLNPTCVAACPSGAIYKREEDGIVLIDQEKCRGWRMCVSGCPYKKIYYNWSPANPRSASSAIRASRPGQPTVCSETCVGRIRYLGVMLYDADRIAEAASAPTKRTSTRRSSQVFLDPNDPKVIEQARLDGMPGGLARAPAGRRSTRWRWTGRSPSRCTPNTARCRWSGTRPAAVAAPVGGRASGKIGVEACMPDVRSLRIPVRYLANLLTAGKEAPVVSALERMLAMRAYMRAKTDRRGDRRAMWPVASADWSDDRGHVSRHGDRQLRGPLRHPDQPSRGERGCLRCPRFLRLFLRQRLLGRHLGDRPFRRQAQEAGPDPDRHLQGARLDLMEAQERYVHLFDRTRTLSLHLFEHVHGESRDRGQAMVDLMEMYERAGLEIDAKELPDYLPLFLEFLSTRSTEEIHDLLAQTAHILNVLAERLTKRDSAYAGVMVALGTLAGVEPDAALVERLLSTPEDDPDDLAALDKVWEDEIVTFGGNAGENACGPDRLRSQLRAAGRKPADPAKAPIHA
jgi:nitrate reductase beta subunit